MGPLAERNQHDLVFDLKYPAMQETPDSPINDNKRKMLLSVCFLECPQYRETISRDDLSQKEIDDTWYSAEEYRYIKTVNTITVRIMAGGSSLNSEIYCARGLECRTPEGWENRVRNKNLVKRVVLREQEIQVAHGTCNPNMIEQVSFGASYHAQQEARERAQEDHAAALKLQQSNGDDEDTTVHEDDFGMDTTYFSFF